MHPTVYCEFERICATRQAAGRVLEVGAVPTPNSLLRMRGLASATERVGINLDGPHVCDGYTVLKGNANDMACFADRSFDTVLCNAMLEHDKFFWKSIAEMHRILRAGGLLVIGVPGFTRGRREKRMKRLLNRLPGNDWLNMVVHSTPTFEIHNAPGDYYRFSPQALKEVFFDGFTDVQIEGIMVPPRLIGSGLKRA